jgi:surface antigen
MSLRFKTAFCSVLLIATLAVPTAANAQTFWQCAPFARVFSGIQLFGSAGGWWSQAIGKYAQGTAPKLGSVLVFKAIGSMRSGHVATVTRVISDRIVKVTHANWSSRGNVERDVTVMDASAKGDWSAVKVWYGPIGDVGTKAYPTYGFIYAGAKAVANRAEAVARDLTGQDVAVETATSTN